MYKIYKWADGHTGNVIAKSKYEALYLACRAENRVVEPKELRFDRIVGECEKDILASSWFQKCFPRGHAQKINIGLSGFRAALKRQTA